MSVGGLDPDLLALLAGCTPLDDLLKRMFRVRVAETSSQEVDCLPDISGRYILCEDEVRFVPTFPLDCNVKYRAIFEPPAEKPLVLDFLIPLDERVPALTEVSQIFPSSDLLPENLLRFYVCFSNPMQRGHALEQIVLLDSDGQRVPDALYRPPVELWDRTMRHLTVLLDPGRLKRWVGPNVELGPPLKVGQAYILEVGSSMKDLHGRPLRERFRKHFFVGEPIREQIAVEGRRVVPPGAGSMDPLVLTFSTPLDWALLLRMITVRSPNGDVTDGQVAVDDCERRWTFSPSSPWRSGAYQVAVEPDLEDVCGNNLTGAFDRPLQKAPDCAINAGTVASRNVSTGTGARPVRFVTVGVTIA